MTTKIIQSENGLTPVFRKPTASADVVAFNSAPLHVYNMREDELLATGAGDEFDIDSFIQEQNAGVQREVAKARPWVADALYGGKKTLATLRLKAGLSQHELAARTGVKQPHISRYESGMHEPGIFQARAMATALGVTLDEFAEALSRSAAKSAGA